MPHFASPAIRYVLSDGLLCRKSSFCHLVDGVQVRLDAGLNDVRIRCPARNYAAFEIDLDGNLAKGILAACHGTYGIIQEPALKIRNLVPRLVAGVYRPVACGLRLNDFVLLFQPDYGLGGTIRPRHNVKTR